MTWADPPASSQWVFRRSIRHIETFTLSQSREGVRGVRLGVRQRDRAAIHRGSKGATDQRSIGRGESRDSQRRIQIMDFTSLSRILLGSWKIFVQALALPLCCKPADRGARSRVHLELSASLDAFAAEGFPSSIPLGTSVASVLLSLGWGSGMGLEAGSGSGVSSDSGSSIQNIEIGSSA